MAKKRSLRYIKLSKIIPNTILSISEGILFFKSILHNNESVECHINLNGIDKNKSYSIENTCAFSNVETSKKIGVLTNKIITFEENYNILYLTLEKMEALIESGNLHIIKLFIHSSDIKKIAPFSKYLKKKRLMPSKKDGTVSNDLQSAVSSYYNSIKIYKLDKNGIFHVKLGRLNDPLENLLQTYNSIIDSIKALTTIDQKNKIIKNIFLCTTMSPSIEISNSN